MAENDDKSGKEYTAIDIVDGSKKSKKCIFRVPNVLRRQKPEAYTPDVVSIGPFHDREQKNKEEAKTLKAGKKGGISEKDYEFMKRVKESYLDEVLKRMEIKHMEDFFAKVTEHSRQACRQKKQKEQGEDDKTFNNRLFDERARSFYAEPLDEEEIAREDFIKMMILDGCFLVQLFRKCNNSGLRDLEDLVFNMDCMFHFLCHDILLLENQLPWFVLYSVYNLTHHLYPGELSLPGLILQALSIVPSLKQSTKFSCHCDTEFLHILDLVRTSIVPPPTEATDEGATEGSGAGKVAKNNNPTKEQQVNSGSKRWRGESGENEAVHEDLLGPDVHQIRTATALSKADIKFKGVNDKNSIMDIQFEDVRCYRNGTLVIPQLNVGISSETLFRNLIAAEQCYHGYSNEITSYAIFMDNLISSKEDMELLSKENVIGNMMSEEDGCEFFSNLYKDIPHNHKFYYKELCKKVNERYKMRRYTWLAILKSEKFSNPWRILAFGIGFVLLFLTAWSSANNIRIHWKK